MLAAKHVMCWRMLTYDMYLTRIVYAAIHSKPIFSLWSSLNAEDLAGGLNLIHVLGECVCGGAGRVEVQAVSSFKWESGSAVDSFVVLWITS